MTNHATIHSIITIAVYILTVHDEKYAKSTIYLSAKYNAV